MALPPRQTDPRRLLAPPRQRRAPHSPQPPTAREDIFLEPRYAPDIQHLIDEEQDTEPAPRRSARR
ncbi:hypothetical protein ACFVQ9_26040 [Streptomyces goshikiensis]|uniref:hypothetical protein n=1 Tax=Streptomyces goshikiensis TaxID=1942 RepID=UPI003693B025